MPDTKVVEVRLAQDPHALDRDQAMQLIRLSPGHEISVGLGYGGTAAAVALEVPNAIAADLGHQIARKAEELGLTVTLVETLDYDEYEARSRAADLEDA